MFIIISFIVFLLLLIYLNRSEEEYENQYVRFLSKEETKKFIEEDKDFYIDSLSEADLSARKEETQKGYKLKCLNDVIEVKDKEKMTEYCKEADKWLKNRELKYIGKNHKIDEIKWIIGMTKGYYEGGYPHTRGKVIFLSSNIENKDKKDIISMLIHEKVHIYERYNREKVIKELELYGYKKDIHKSKEYLIRANPDLDEYLYKNPENERMMFKYWNEEPKDITDGVENGGYEHPFEMISYEIENDFLKDYNKEKNE